MRFSPEFLDDIRGRLRLADVISRRVQLKRRGREYLGLCPFHREKTPSFTVNEDKGFYHCFGCGAHGDAVEFVMRTEGLSFPEAVERLAGEAGVPMPVESPEARARAKERASLYEVVEAACDWFERQLATNQGSRARDYLAHRGVDEETRARFRLGYAPDARGALKAALAERGKAPGGGQRFPEAMLVTAGLLIKPDDGGAAYDRFRGRVVFPITDRRGRVIAFGGRALGDGVTPKYLNSPETPLFHKGRVLYGFAAARRAAFDRGEIIVTEGYMDVIALHRAGFPNAVAPLGTALTEEQMQELWRVAAEPMLCFDGDEAGRRAAAAAAERALPVLRPGCSLRFAALPAGEDPDSLIAGKGPEAMREVLAAAQPLSQMVWEAETAARPLDTPERRAHLETRLEEKARRIADPKVRSEYLRYFRARLREALGPGPAARIGRAGWPGWRPTGLGAPGAAPRGRVDSGPILERILLAAIINHPQILNDVGEELGRLTLSTPDLDRLRQEILEIGANQPLDTASLKSHLVARGFSDVVGQVLHRETFVHAGFARPGTSPEEVRKGWVHAFGRHQLPIVRAQLREAQKAFAEEGSRENSERLSALQKHLTEIQSAVSAVEDTASRERTDYL